MSVLLRKKSDKIIIFAIIINDAYDSIKKNKADHIGFSR